MSKTARYCIYAFIIAFCIIAIIVGVNAQFFSTKENDEIPDINISNVVSVDEEVDISNKFMQLFDNKLPQFKEYDNVKKMDLNKNYVYIYSENPQLPNGPYTKKLDGKYDIVAYLPVFNINSEVTNNFNNITMNYFVKMMNDVITNSVANTSLTISFTANVNDNILSVAIIAKLKEGDKPQKIMIQGYNYDLINNKEIKVADVLTKNKVDVATANSKIEKVIKAIREVDSSVIIMIDNCYGELTNKIEPSDLGADILVGSLIKNLGGGIAPNGAYVVGKHNLIELVAERLTLPGEGREVGPSLGMNKKILQGLFMAPSVVSSSLKTAILTAKVMENLGYKVSPKSTDIRTDIVQTIEFGNSKDLINYVQGIQIGSPIDSSSLPVPDDMPGYDDQVIMAAGAFVQGSSIELSCDAPLREPYVAFQQGGLTYEYGKLGLMKAVERILEE